MAKKNTRGIEERAGEKDVRNKVKKRTKSVLFLVILIGFFALSFDIKVASAETGKTITILFTHDMHDHLLPVKDLQDGVISNSGGYARLQSALSAEMKSHPDALLVDAGDFSMGTPFQTIFTSDSPELRIMGEMGYDVVTLGNHEFDYRASGLAGSLEVAKKSQDRLPQIVQSNTRFPIDQNGSMTPTLLDLEKAYQDYGVKDYTVLEKNGIKIGVFGLMGKDAASNAPKSEVQFVEPIENAQRVVKLLKQQEKVDMIVCLSHSGTWTKQSDSEDEILAQKVPEIDIIISAHTHTKLSEPILVGKTIIGSVEDSSKYFGSINVVRDSDDDWKLESYHLQQIGDQLLEDKRIAERINTYKNQVQTKYFDQFKMKFDEVLAIAPFNFQTVNRITKNHQEDPLGNLISDSYIYAVKKAEGATSIPVDVAIVPVGTIRSSFYKGNITTADAFSASSLGIGPDNIPGYPLISVYLTGKELKTVCEVDASISPMMEDAQLFMSGLNFTFNPNRLIFNKVIDTSLQRPDGALEELDDKKLYRVVAGLYSAQMLSVVGDKSLGLLSIVPKTKEGIPISDFEAQIISNTVEGNKAEVKEWQAIAEYLQSFDKVNGVSQIPQYYAETHSRKVMDNNFNILALMNRPNQLALAVYALAVVILVLLIILSAKIVSRIKRREFHPDL